jgi:hypothetical protein
VPCVTFSQSARQSSVPGKNTPCALCRALGQNAHGKGNAVRIPVFVVRRRRTAKSAILVVKEQNKMMQVRQPNSSLVHALDLLSCLHVPL